ncbi:hypothetical protein PG989_006725 [Apiospora arundinis]|uniref:Uncharacterized protein n=1 Tax=Apiospora arundinis TaxID=335852 RepID=A0ABR2I8V1_9PEZI
MQTIVNLFSGMARRGAYGPRFACGDEGDCDYLEDTTVGGGVDENHSDWRHSVEEKFPTWNHWPTNPTTGT